MILANEYLLDHRHYNVDRHFFVRKYGITGCQTRTFKGFLIFNQYF